MQGTAKITVPLKYHSISCVCRSCLDQDGRLTFLTTNGFLAEVVFYGSDS